MELSWFCDESGSDGLDGKYYLLTVVLHDQRDGISESISQYEQSLADKGLPDIALHASPLMYGKDEYKDMSMEDRKRMLSTFRVFFRHLPIRYWCFSAKVSEFQSADAISNAMRRALVDFLFDNLAYFQDFDTVNVYYDNGQHYVREALHKAIDYVLSKGAVDYRLIDPTDYRLAQAADYICTMELTALKYAAHQTSSTDEKTFGSWSDFKKGVLKEVRAKRL